MVVDRLIEQILRKKNPCIAGIDPEWSKIPECYKSESLSKPETILTWALDIIDAVADIVPAVKPQMAFFEVYGPDGLRVHQSIVQHAHKNGLIVVDDSKRNDIGNTAAAYAFAHLAKDGPVNADFLTISPFLGTDSIQPFIDTAITDRKGIFILVKTSNPSSVEISEAINSQGERISNWLARYVNTIGKNSVGNYGYSSIGAVVGATFPDEAKQLRQVMRNNLFLVPGFGAQGGNANDILPCFNEDGLGAIISSSRGILYHHLNIPEYDGSRTMYKQIVRKQAEDMRNTVYDKLKTGCKNIKY